MKKFLMVVLLLAMCGCKGFVAGDFSEKRNHLHNLGHEEDYCQKNPDRCVKGVPW